MHCRAALAMVTCLRFVIAVLNASLLALVACHVLHIVWYNLTGQSVSYWTVTYVAIGVGVVLGLIFPKFFANFLPYPMM
jgi:hypothetical protein